MSLKDELKSIVGNRRKFILFRICGVDTKTAMKLCGVRQGTYNSWLHDQTFIELYQRKEELALDYVHEAIKLLRRDTQLSAVLLEEKVVEKMKEEIETGNYSLIKTNLARDVYSRLMGELDVVPKSDEDSWGKKMYFLINRLQVGRGNGGEVVEGEFEAISEQATEHPESHSIESGEQASP